ncbi:MAG TPA: cellulase family glycosylhydrolase [Stenotrophobium sp.]|jgi:endoglycosylceramidase|nr:cellulase family glycosylhydrolase [Stenotrophobium sp.]
MKSMIRNTLLVFALLLSACGSSVSLNGDAAKSAATLPLNHAGRWVTDAQGRVVILHGINMVYKRPPYAPDAIGFGEDDAAFLAAEGYNSVRLGLIYKAVEPQPGVYDDGYIARIKATADTLARHGIVSLLDFHQDLYNEKFSGEGFPDWAVEDDGLPNQPQTQFTLDYFLIPGLNRAFDHFWNNDPAGDGIGLQDHYAAAWRHVAEQFKGDTAVLGYDLFNEPWPGTQYATCVVPLAGCPIFDASLARFTERTVSAIRQVDPVGLVWYEPNVIFNNGVQTDIGDIGDAHAGFSFHDYCLQEPFTGSNTACDTFDDLVFNNSESHIAGTGDAVLMTEFGASDDLSNIEAMVDRADRHMIGWLEWHYCGCNDPTTTGEGDTQAIVLDPAKPPVGDNLKAAKLAVLSRPYPQAIAGVPKSYGFDAGSGIFSLDYLTLHADGSGDFPAGSQTVIVLPARQYPSGYAVTVRGARIVSAPGAMHLLLASCANVGEVTVSVGRTGSSSATCDAGD